MTSKESFVKVIFELEQDEDNYPPYGTESLWAEPLGEGRFRLENIPFFAVGVSCNDIVRATRQEEGLLFDELLEESGHTTVRVIVYDPNQVKVFRDLLRERGCDSELSDIDGLIAVDVPPGTDYRPIREMLEEGREQEVWGYEESALAHNLG